MTDNDAYVERAALYADPDGVHRFGPDELDALIHLIADAVDVLRPPDRAVMHLIRKCHEIHRTTGSMVAFDRNRTEP